MMAKLAMTNLDDLRATVEGELVNPSRQATTRRGGCVTARSTAREQDLLVAVRAAGTAYVRAGNK